MSLILNVASVLLSIVSILVLVGSLTMIFLPFSDTSLSEKELGGTLSEIRDFNPKLVDNIELNVRVRGLYLLILALSLSVISLIPYRNGEIWAWYAELGIGGIWLSGFFILCYIGVKRDLYKRSWIIISTTMLILWIVGLALPAMEILG